MFNQFPEFSSYQNKLTQLKNYQNKSILVKLGGALLNSPALISNICRQIAFLNLLEIKTIVVHGAGPNISDFQKKLGITPEFINGLRKTDAKTLELVEMVVAGQAQPLLVKELNSFGVRAIGLKGYDANLFEVKQTENANLGFVGDVTKVNQELITILLASNIIPVIGSVGADNQKQSYNINADLLSAALAKKLNCQEFFLLTQVGGILIDGKIKPEFSLAEAQALLKSDLISDGMIPKLVSCLSVLEQGISSAWIAGAEPTSLIDSLLKNNLQATKIDA